MKNYGLKKSSDFVLAITTVCECDGASGIFFPGGLFEVQTLFYIILETK